MEPALSFGHIKITKLLLVLWHKQQKYFHCRQQARLFVCVNRADWRDWIRSTCMSSPLTNFQETCADQLPLRNSCRCRHFLLCVAGEQSGRFIIICSQSATGDCKFHKLQFSFYSHCAKLISILGAQEILPLFPLWVLICKFRGEKPIENVNVCASAAS